MPIDVVETDIASQHRFLKGTGDVVRGGDLGEGVLGIIVSSLRETSDAGALVRGTRSGALYEVGGKRVWPYPNDYDMKVQRLRPTDAVTIIIK